MQLQPEAATAGGGAEDVPPAPSVELQGVTKAFGGIVACDGVHLRVMPGRITALLGENGAGKSTLMHILLGLVPMDSGRILVGGRPVTIADPQAAANLGLTMVHQHLSLVPTLRVWENVVLGVPARLQPEAARRRVAEVAARYRLGVDPDARVESLSAGERQRVELVRALAREPRVLVLDEPTSVLTAGEARSLFSVLRRVVEQEGRSVVVSSHRLEEVLAAADDVVILRGGRVVARHPAGEVSAATLAAEMTAGPGGPPLEVAAAPPTHPGEAALRLRDLVVAAPRGGRSLDGVSLEVRPGEIVGLAAIEGNGQAALLDLLIDAVPAVSGAVEVRGRRVEPGRPGAMHGAGVGVVTDDPRRSGLVLDMSVAENLLLGDLDDYTARGLLDRRLMRRRARELVDRFGIRTPSVDVPVRTLSGGNQQRVVLARELSRTPAALVATQVTRGLDAAAAELVEAAVRAAAAAGVGVILVSAEPEELVALCHRILVLRRGRLTGEVSRRRATVDLLAAMMAGEAA